MRLAAVSPFVDRQHGTERAVAELLERLAHNYGCEIHLYAQRVEDLKLSDGKDKVESETGAIFWHRVPSIPGPHLVQFAAWILFNGMQRWWDNLSRGVRFDIVLSPGINCLHADVVVVHALFQRLEELSREQHEKPLGRGFLRRLHRRAYYRLLTHLERRIYSDSGIPLAAVSQRTAKLLARYFQRQDVRIIPYGVDTKQFHPALRLALRAEARRHWRFREHEFVILLIGNDWGTKGLGTLLEAVAPLSDLPFRLLVVGSDEPGAFRGRAIQLGIQGRCVWEPPRREVLDFYAATDVYVSPSREDSFGLPVAEAMACGLPVITSVLAGVSDYIQDGVDGFVLSDPCDTQALAQLLRILHADPALRHKIGEAAHKKASEWTWDKHAEGAWELLQGAAAKKAGSKAPRELP